VILVFSLAPGLGGLLTYLMTLLLSVSTHPVTDESVVGISVSAAREFAAFVPKIPT
jgi:hypothetical protein